jgi:hypothetical protein
MQNRPRRNYFFIIRLRTTCRFAPRVPDRRRYSTASTILQAKITKLAEEVRVGWRKTNKNPNQADFAFTRFFHKFQNNFKICTIKTNTN